MAKPKHTTISDELKAFDDAKTGVKGLVDNTHITEIPSIFIHPKNMSSSNSLGQCLNLPLIDLGSINDDLIRRREAVDLVRVGSGECGFFQVVNHGIPEAVLTGMLGGARRFYEQDGEERKGWYTRDWERGFIYNSNFDLYSRRAADWRDTFYCQMAPNLPQPQDLPQVCKDIMVEYTKHMLTLGSTLFQILSEALGLKPNHLEDMKCGEGLALLGHYYPECPQPTLTYGTSPHADSDFLTVLLNEPVSGLQVLYKNRWVDVPCVPGALVVNIGDLLQLVSNDRFISAQHRVVVNNLCSRVSVACFFRSDVATSTELYGPIEELLSEDSPPKYRATTVKEYVTYYNTKGLHGILFCRIFGFDL